MRAWLLLLVACSSHGEQQVEVATFPAAPVSQLDLVFVVDNSNGMTELQKRLTAAIPSLSLAVTDVHAGIATTDLGTAGSLDFDHPAPAIGVLQQGGCANWGDNGAVHAIDLASAKFEIGGSGCGFEQPLQSLRRATVLNSTFWRSGASRAVVLLTDEDDCSIRDVAFFGNDPALGPLTSFRCTKLGIVCDESLDAPGVKTNCRPRTDSLVEDPAITKTDLESAVRPEQLTFSAIAGPPTVAVEQRIFDGTAQLALAHSCTFQTPTGPHVVDPGLRIASLVDSFGSRGGFYSACDDFAPSLANISRTINRSLGIACIDAPAEDCEARAILDRSSQSLPRCPANGNCFDVVDDVACGGPRVVVDWKTTPLPGTRVEVTCP